MARAIRALLAPAKGRSADEKHVADYAAAPQIALFGVVPAEDLRACVVQRPAWHLHLRVLLNDLGEAEVNKLDSILILTCGSSIHPIFQLEVSVDNVVAVPCLTLAAQEKLGYRSVGALSCSGFGRQEVTYG